MYQFDVVLLTDSRYLNPENPNQYKQNVLTEDELVLDALKELGLKTWRTNWDNPDFDWSNTRYILFRTTWDYFDRIDEFSSWLSVVNLKTEMLNPFDLIKWNIDKSYLKNLSDKGINIPPTIFLKAGEKCTLKELSSKTHWDEFILKPAISGGARHTYRFNRSQIKSHEEVFQQLIKSESMMLQEFQHKVLEDGEVAFMVFGGKYSHAILKKGKVGDFRVQDDHGGTVHAYQANTKEIEFAERVVASCPKAPVYARVDVIIDNDNEPSLIELELIEPEMWFRNYPPAAKALAYSIVNYIGNKDNNFM